MGHYAKPSKGKKSGGPTTWKGVLLVVLIILLILASVFAFILSKLDLIQYDTGAETIDYSTVPPTRPTEESVATEPPATVNLEGLEMLETAPPIVDSEIISSKDVLNILLIGTDERTNEFNVDARSDSMIIASINQKENTVKLVSLERGIAAPILEGYYKGKYDWLTNIFRYGGADLLVETVEQMFKVDIDNYIRINFCTVTTVIDAIGGIELDITKNEQWFLNMYHHVYQSTPTQQPIVVGMNTFDGGMALGYARLRAIDDEEVTLYMVNPKAPCFVKDDEGKYIYLILPVNIL